MVGRRTSFEAAAELAGAIRGAEFRARPSGEHSCFDITDLLVSETLEFVCQHRQSDAPERVLTTFMFSDIVGSTEMLSAGGDAHWRHQLGVHYTVVDALLAEHGGRRVTHTGDRIFAIFDAPTRACLCRLKLVTALATRGIRIRVGVHVGECERRDEEWSGLAVHVGARIGAMAGPGEVFASRTVRELSAGSGLKFEDRSAHKLKGLSDDVDVYRALARSPLQALVGHNALRPGGGNTTWTCRNGGPGLMRCAEPMSTALLRPPNPIASTGFGASRTGRWLQSRGCRRGSRAGEIAAAPRARPQPDNFCRPRNRLPRRAIPASTGRGSGWRSPRGPARSPAP